MLTQVIREEAARYGIQFQELAQKLHVTPSTISMILGDKRPMTKDTEGLLLQELNSPRASEVRCSMCKGNSFSTRFLDNIDSHPVVAIDKLIEEAEEFIEAAKAARKVMLNKPPGFVFGQEEDAIVMRMEDHAADLITGGKTLLIKMQEWFQRPVSQTMQRHVAKIESKGYVKNPACAGTQYRAK